MSYSHFDFSDIKSPHYNVANQSKIAILCKATSEPLVHISRPALNAINKNNEIINNNNKNKSNINNIDGDIRISEKNEINHCMIDKIEVPPIRRRGLLHSPMKINQTSSYTSRY